MLKIIAFVTLVLLLSSCTSPRYQFLEKSGRDYWVLDTSTGDIIRKNRENEILEVKQESVSKFLFLKEIL